MDFLINGNELTALCGLPHIQQLAYLRGIRPYMDVKTGIVGIKRGISYQSISEQLYIEPHPGIKSVSYSRAQFRRALSGLERAGLINLQSVGLKLILKCHLATLGYFVQNKPVTNTPHQDVSSDSAQLLENKGLGKVYSAKASIYEPSKPDTPLKDNNYFIFLLSQFEKFWDLYPLKKAKQNTWEVFQTLNPAPELIAQINSALAQQIQFHQQQQSHGHWVAAWKYPANWLSQHCWEDEIQIETPQEKNNAIHTKHNSKHIATDPFWESCKSGFEEEADDSNVIYFGNVRRNT